jgi:hypothetical protein
MFRPHARSAEILLSVALFFTPSAVADQSAMASSFGFFGGRDLDFWKEGKTVKPFFPNAAASNDITDDAVPSSIRAGDGNVFSWKNYADPSSLLFWDDGGDWVPPRPFREAAANPTAENLERYLDWQARKMAVVSRFQESLAIAGFSGGQGTRVQSNSIPPKETVVSPKVNWKAVDLVYFYQSSCSHCQAAKSVVEELKNKGVRVSFVQLDAHRNPPLHAGAVPYNESHDRQFNVTSTPTWAFRLGGKTRLITGEVSLQQIESELSSALFGEEK